jgi:hypothetical protein
MGAMDVHATMRQGPDGRWGAATVGEVSVHAEGPTRAACLGALRAAVTEASGPDDPPTLLVEVVPRVAGVAEAAAIIGWDKRRVVTYIDRGRFPEPVQSLASGRVWLWDDVEAYAREWRERRAARPRRPAPDA